MRKPWTLAMLIASGVLAGCAVGPDYEEPKPEMDAVYSGQSLISTEAAEIDREWWKLFGDPLLDELVALAVEANHDLAAAEARLRQARAIRREYQWDFLPAPEIRASALSQRQSRDSVVGGPQGERDYDIYEASFDASWEIDLFGRVRRANQAARASLQAVQAARDDMRLSVTAEVARNYFELRGAQQQLAVAQRNAENQRRSLEQVQARLDAGSGTALDAARAEAQIQNTLSLVPPLEAAVTRAQHRIEVLVGRRPGQLWDRLGPPAPLPALPTSVRMDDPAALLRRRPDLRIAERQLESTSAQIGVAIADLFPRITLNGSIGVQGVNLESLLDDGNDFRQFGPSMSWAFLDLGRVHQRIKAAGAQYEEAYATYEQTVLLALEDVENALSDYSRERRRQEYLAAAARASVLAADLAGQRFEAGVADFLTALDANRTALEAEDLLAASQTRAGTALVALYKALGGGWEVVEPPSEAGSSP